MELSNEWSEYKPFRRNFEYHSQKIVINSEKQNVLLSKPATKSKAQVNFKHFQHSKQASVQQQAFSHQMA